MDASTLARYIVTKCTNEQFPVSNLQLQKILFFIQRKVLLSTGEPLFYDEIQAWHFGPVVPTVYKQFCGFGPSPIEWVFSKETTIVPSEQLETIDKIVQDKRCLDPWKLVEETHQNGNAWSRIYNGGKGAFRVIPLDYIRRFG